MDKKNIILHTAAFLIPSIIMVFAFAMRGVYPFGSETIVIHDFHFVYYPFIGTFWHMLRNGESLLWTWNAGGGHDFISYFSMLANPFNFLAILLPREWLREILTFSVPIRVGLAGLFMSFYLRGVTEKKFDYALPVFSSMFALCAWIFGYYWNIIWLDTFAMLPLVMLGLYKLVYEGKYALYMASLALAIIFSFYIAFFICIFTTIMFFGYCLVKKFSAKEFLQKFGVIAAYTTVGIGMSAFMLLPAIRSMQYIYRGAYDVWPTSVYLETGIAEFTSLLLPFSPINTGFDEIPNIYGGFIGVILIPVFLISDKIKIGEKIAYSSILLFLLLSVNVNVLNFAWHGFSRTLAIPTRFSFLIAFMLVLIGYKTFLALREEIRTKDLIAMGVGIIVLHAVAVFGVDIIHVAVISLIMSGLYLFAFFCLKKWKHSADIISFMLVCLLVIELISASVLSIAIFGDTVERIDHPPHYVEFHELLAHKNQVELSRTGIYSIMNHNDGLAYSFPSVGVFSGLANTNTSAFINSLGTARRPNLIIYPPGLPLLDAFLNIRYIIAQSDNRQIIWDNWTPVAHGEHFSLYGNNLALPFGFMVNSAAAGYVPQENPFLNQNNFFSRTTGLDENLFYFFDIPADSQEFIFTMPTNGILYIYASDDRITNIALLKGDEVLRDMHITRREFTYMLHMGWFEEAETLELQLTMSDESGEDEEALSVIAVFNHELFERGIEILSHQTLEIIEFSSTRISGRIAVENEGLLYTSLPHAGIWRAFANGNEVEIISIGGAMAAIELPSGEHEIEFRFHNRFFNAGVIISIISLAVFAVYIFYRHRKGFWK